MTEVDRAVTEKQRVLETVLQQAERVSDAKPLVDGHTPVSLSSEDVSEKTLHRLGKQLSNLQGHREAQAFAVLSLAERQKLTAKTISVLLDAKRFDAVKPLFEVFPFADAIFGVFQSALHDLAARMLETQIIEPYLERLASQALRSGSTPALRNGIRKEARRFVEEQGQVERCWLEAVQNGNLESLGRAREDVDRRAAEIRAVSEQLEADIDRRKEHLAARRREALARLRQPFEQILHRLPTVKGITPEDAFEVLSSSRSTEKEIYQEDAREYLRRVEDGYARGEITVAKTEQVERLATEVLEEKNPAEQLIRIEAVAGPALALGAIRRLTMSEAVLQHGRVLRPSPPPGGPRSPLPKPPKPPRPPRRVAPRR